MGFNVLWLHLIMILLLLSGRSAAELLSAEAHDGTVELSTEHEGRNGGAGASGGDGGVPGGVPGEGNNRGKPQGGGAADVLHRQPPGGRQRHRSSSHKISASVSYSVVCPVLAMSLARVGLFF